MYGAILLIVARSEGYIASSLPLLDVMSVCIDFTHQHKQCHLTLISTHNYQEVGIGTPKILQLYDCGQRILCLEVLI